MEGFTTPKCRNSTRLWALLITIGNYGTFCSATFLLEKGKNYKNKRIFIPISAGRFTLKLAGSALVGKLFHVAPSRYVLKFFLNSALSLLWMVHYWFACQFSHQPECFLSVEPNATYTIPSCVNPLTTSTSYNAPRLQVSILATNHLENPIKTHLINSITKKNYRYTIYFHYKRCNIQCNCPHILSRPK